MKHRKRQRVCRDAVAGGRSFAAGFVRVLACLVALAVPASAAQAFELLDVETDHEGDAYLLRIEARFSASPEQLLAVLTDYDNIHDLHPRIVQSRSLGRVGPDTEEVATRFEGCVLMFCRAVQRVEQIRVEERRLVARDVPGRGSFREGTTTWRLEEIEGGTRLRYESRFVPVFSVTPLVGPLVLLRSLRQTTLETMREIDRRAIRLDE